MRIVLDSRLCCVIRDLSEYIVHASHRTPTMPRQPPSPPHLATDLADQPAELHTTSQVRTLLAETQALSARLAALHEVATAMQSSLDTATVLSTLAREARWVLDFQYCSVAEVIEGGYSERVLLSVTAPTSDAPQQRSLAEGGPVADAIRAEHALLLPQLDQQPNIPPGMASALIVPLRSRGTIIGTLNFFSTQERHYRIDDMRIAGALAAQAAVVIQNTQLFAELTSAHDELQTILESISDGVIVVLEDYTILLVNNAARAILMLPPVPMAGKRPTALLQGRRPDGRRLVTRRQLVQLRAQDERRHCSVEQWPSSGVAAYTDPGSARQGRDDHPARYNHACSARRTAQRHDGYAGSRFALAAHNAVAQPGSASFAAYHRR
jgi:GAF domain-containing protein